MIPPLLMTLIFTDVCPRILDIKGYPKGVTDVCPRILDIKGYPKGVTDVCPRVLDIQGVSYIIAYWFRFSV